MPVLNDYKCAKHGYFEATEAACPMKNCEAEVMLVFLQAPAIGSTRTRNIDKTADQLAMDFNMTNIRSAKTGESQAGMFDNVAAAKAQEKREPRPGDAAIWGGSSRFDMTGALMGRYAKPVRDEQVSIRPQDAGNLRGPRAGSYIADHENLSLPK